MHGTFLLFNRITWQVMENKLTLRCIYDILNWRDFCNLVDSHDNKIKYMWQVESILQSVPSREFVNWEWNKRQMFVLLEIYILSQFLCSKSTTVSQLNRSKSECFTNWCFLTSDLIFCYSLFLWVLWWLTLCQFDWVKRYPKSWQDIFLGISAKVFPEEVSMWFSGLRREVSPSPLWISIFCWGHRYNKSKRNGECFPLFSSWPGMSIFSCLWTSGLLDL